MAGIATQIVILLLLLVANGVFAMSELAVASSRKARLQSRAEEGDAGAAAALALADDPKAADSEEGFTPLFNGKDLTGWIYGGKNGETKAGNGYQVENEVLFCTAHDGGNLFTEKEYKDFVFRFEFKLTPNANNGIAIRAPTEGDSAYQGMEIQVLDDSGSDYQTLQPYQYHGSIYDLVAAKRGSQKPVGEWNMQEVVADGRHIKVTLNGNVIVDANLEEVKDPEVLKTHPGLARTSGHIGFLGHGTRVEFRNVRIKELKK